MLPIKDDLPTRRTPYLTIGLIIANVAVYAWQFMLSQRAELVFLYHWGVVPGWITGLGAMDIPPQWGPRMFTLLTYQFLHGGLFHLAGNMLYLWIFGNNIEDALGWWRFLAFYLAGGIIAAGMQIAGEPASVAPMVGASGAIAAVLGAYFLLYPRSNVVVLIWLFFFVRLIRVPAVLVLGLWFFMQVISLGGGGGGVAWLAHIGGFVAGLLMVRLFMPRRPTYTLH